MKTNPKLKVQTIAKRHVDQLGYTHAWDGEYPFPQKRILGRIAGDGFILVEDKETGGLEKVSPVAFNGWQLEKLGARWRVNGKWEYAPTPHTKYAEAAQQAYCSLPQIFVD